VRWQVASQFNNDFRPAHSRRAKERQMRRWIFVFVFLVGLVSTACGGHRAPQMISHQPADMVAPSIPSCWDPALRGEFSEHYDNSGSSTPTIFKIEDEMTGQIVCLGVLRAADKAVGPAIWAHQTPTQRWVVTGQSLVSVVNAGGFEIDRTKGRVDIRSVRLEYSRGYGWYTRCPC